MLSFARAICLFAALLCAAAGQANTLRLGTDVVPVAQQIRLHVDPREASYSGSVRIELEVKEPVSMFRFHAAGLTIRSLQLGGGIEVTHTPDADQTVRVSVGGTLQPGRHVLTIDYEAPFNRQSVGLYKMLKDGEPYLFTQFEAIDARRAFPCWDEPSFKLPYQLTVEIPAQYSAISNTPVAAESGSGTWKSVRFAPTKPLPAYLIALAVGQFEFTPIANLGVPGRIVAPKGQGALTQLAASVTPQVLAAIERYFGSSYPFEKLDLIAVPDFWPGAMENPGAITYRDTILLADAARATPAHKRTLARVTAHELAHMWFGNMVTMAWWDDLWLNEAFADWMGDKITEQVFPELGGAIAKMQNIQQVMNLDARPSTDPVRKHNATPEDAMRNTGIQYDKGTAVLSMFEQWIGPEQFRQAVIEHLKANAWSSADATQFFAALANHAPRGTTEAMDSFIAQPGLPLVRVEWPATAPGQVRLTQQRFAAAGAGVAAQSWRIPVTLLYSDGKRTRTIPVFLDAPEKTVVLDGERIEWLFPNARAAGYYRWQIPAAAMHALAKRATEILSPAERLAFLGNAGALLNAGRLRGDEYLDILGQIGFDPHPQVVQSVLAALGQMRLPFVTTENRAAYAAFVRRILSPVLQRVGLSPAPGEPETARILRPALIGWLANAGEDPSTIEFAKAQAHRFLMDPQSVDPSSASVFLGVAARDGNAALFEEFVRRFEAAKTPADRMRFLGALGEFRRAELRARALDFALSGPLHVSEIFAIPLAGNETVEDREQHYRWVTANYAEFAKRLPPQFLSRLAFAAGGCEPARLRAASEFFAARKVEGTDRALARVTEQVNECASLRERELARVSAYLRRGQ